MASYNEFVFGFSPILVLVTSFCPVSRIGMLKMRFEYLIEGGKFPLQCFKIMDDVTFLTISTQLLSPSPDHHLVISISFLEEEFIVFLSMNV
jgi:hypothetical protein